MHGAFFEDIYFAADGGLHAEMIKNCSFEFEVPLMAWSQPSTDKYALNKKSESATIIKVAENKTNPRFARFLINNDEVFEMINEDFRGMGVKKESNYNLSLKAANHNGEIKKIIIQFIDKNKKVLDETSIVPTSNDRTSYSARFTANKLK